MSQKDCNIWNAVCFEVNRYFSTHTENTEEAILQIVLDCSQRWTIDLLIKEITEEDIKQIEDIQDFWKSFAQYIHNTHEQG